MSAKKGLKIFGEPGAEAIVAELQQVHYRKVIRPVFGHTLTREQKKAALHYLMYLKQKRCGRIKARGCADGRKQRLYKTKEETSSPTVRTESVFLSAVVDAFEGRKHRILDVPGAFMQANIDELVHVKFEGEIAELLVRVDPDLYKPYMTNENGKPVLYVELQKALYGTLQAALLSWKELSEFITTGLGFTTNPSDQCVANKIINGKQCTLLWHVDDIKLSHVDDAVLDDVVAKLNQRFGKEEPLTVNKEKIHDYLGMQFDYTAIGKVSISMIDFVDSIIDDAPTDMGRGVYATPAVAKLFDVNQNATPLDKQTSEEFHTLVAKLLYLSKRARPDISTAVAFLTTRVTKPTEQDYAKLRRCIGYLRGTREMKLTIEATDPGKIRWYADASFAVHHDMRSHTGVVMTMGKGAVLSMSTRQKINTTSSTEAELVGVADAMPSILWTRQFLEAQGINVTENIIYQDNHSAILLEKNGRRSSGKRTRHIDIKYFHISDRVRTNEVQVEYCPTERMLSDILTKGLGGSQFRFLRNLIMNVPDPHPLFSVSQECVGTYGQSQRSDESTGNYEPHKDKVTSADEVASMASEAETENDWIVVKGRGRRIAGRDERNRAHSFS